MKFFSWQSFIKHNFVEHIAAYRREDVWGRYIFAIVVFLFEE